MASQCPELLTGAPSTVSETTNGSLIRQRRTPLSRVSPTSRAVRRNNNRSLPSLLSRRPYFPRPCSLAHAMVDRVLDDSVAGARPEQVALPCAPSVPAEPDPFVDGCVAYDPAVPAGHTLGTYGAWPDGTPRAEDVPMEIEELNPNNNSSIYYLNEMMSSQGKRVKYDLVSIKGKVHRLEFTVRATCNGIAVYGTGLSKKEARKNAATAFLNQLHNMGLNCDITSTTSNHLLSSTINHEKNVLKTKTELNPIGVLQELCMARRWQLPEYTFMIKDIKNPHDTCCYEVICSLQTYKSKGEGKTKQAAKHQAARFMYDEILNLSQDETMIPSVDIKYQVPSEALFSSNKCLPDFPTLMAKSKMSDAVNCVELFFNQLKLSTNPFINNLQKFNSISEFGTSPVDVLNKIGDEEGFNVSYFEIAKQTDKSEVLVQVSIIPLLVNVGTGNTLEKAQEMAAYSALMYMKLLLEK